jgi:hypothetical protein
MDRCRGTSLVKSRPDLASGQRITYPEKLLLRRAEEGGDGVDAACAQAR